MSTLEERRAERRRRRQMEEEEFRKVNGTMTPEEIQADLEERLARRRKEREERIRAITASISTVNGDDDLERRRRERREARLKASAGDTSEDFSSRRSRRRGTEEDTTEDTSSYRSRRHRDYEDEEEDTSSYRSRRHRGYEDEEETPTYNDTSATRNRTHSHSFGLAGDDTAAAEAAAEAAKEEQRRRQREEEEEEARRQQEREEAEERRRQEQAEARRREEEEEKRREEERIRRKQEADAEFEALETEYGESSRKDVQRLKQPNVSVDKLKLDSLNLWNDVDVDKKDNSVTVIKQNNERGDNSKEDKTIPRPRSNSFDKNNRRITAKIKKFQNLSGTYMKEKEKDRNSNFLPDKNEGFKNRVDKPGKEKQANETPGQKDNSSASPKFKEVNLIVKKVSEKLHQYETKADPATTQNDAQSPDNSISETQKNFLDRWRQAAEAHKNSQSFQSQASPSLSQRLYGNTEFITSRLMERVHESTGNTQIVPTLERSHSSQSGANMRRLSSQSSETPSENTPKQSSPRVEENIADRQGTNCLPKSSDMNCSPKSSETNCSSKSSETNCSQKSSETNCSQKSSETNSATHSLGSSYEDSHTYSRGSSSDEEEARLEQERLEEERQRQEEEARMAADEEKRKKKGKRKGLGGLSPEKKKKLKEISFVDYDTDEEEEKWRVVSERLMPLPNDFDSLSAADLKKLCQQLHNKLAQFESEVYDWEFKCEKQEQEVNELTLKVNDSKGKFVKPVLRKTNKTDAKFAKMKTKNKMEDFRENLKSTGQSKYDVDEEQVKSPDYRDTLKKPVEIDD